MGHQWEIIEAFYDSISLRVILRRFSMTNWKPYSTFCKPLPMKVVPLSYSLLFREDGSLWKLTICWQLSHAPKDIIAISTGYGGRKSMEVARSCSLYALRRFISSRLVMKFSLPPDGALIVIPTSSWFCILLSNEAALS